jgi:hypothetical protein
MTWPLRLTGDAERDDDAGLRLVAETVAAHSDREEGARDLRAEIEADLRANGATMAEIDSGVAFVDAQLREIDASLARLRNHHRFLNVVATLALAVLVVIAWKVIAG